MANQLPSRAALILLSTAALSIPITITAQENLFEFELQPVISWETTTSTTTPAPSQNSASDNADTIDPQIEQANVNLLADQLGLSTTTTTTCTDTPDWTDLYGDSCSYYARPDICIAEGGPGSNGGRGTAIANCCSCGGGVIVASESVDVDVEQTTTTTSTTTTVATAPNGEVGTCGGGDRGNGVCANGKCCSKNGRCRNTPAACDESTLPPTITPSASPNNAPAIPTSTPTTAPPSSTPTVKDYDAITPNWTAFCGPKVVGGFAVAQETCSHLTECNKGIAGETAYGYTGNDCPKNYMCFTGIRCAAPTSTPSLAPSYSPTKSVMPTVAPSGMPSYSPSVSIVPTEAGQTQEPTVSPTISRPPTLYPTLPKPPTVPPVNLQNSITARGSYCGANFEAALDRCSQDTSCNNNDDCKNGSFCFINIRCTIHASETSDHVLGKDNTELSSADDEDEEDEEDEDVSEFDREFDSDPPLGASPAERIRSLHGAAVFLVVAFVLVL